MLNDIDRFSAKVGRHQAEAKLQKERDQKQKEESAKRYAAAMAEEERRERVLAAERRRHEIFEAFVAKQRSKKTKTEERPRNEPHGFTPRSEEARLATLCFDSFMFGLSWQVRTQEGPGFLLSDRHKKALKRLEKQREGEVPKAVGSWWEKHSSSCRQAVLSDLQQLARSAKLSGFEVIKATAIVVLCFA
eukprot:g23079.t1